MSAINAERGRAALAVAESAFNASWPTVMAALNGREADTVDVHAARLAMFEIEQKFTLISAALRRLSDP